MPLIEYSLFEYCIVVSSNVPYYLGNHLFVKRSQYIRIENLLQKQSEKAGMCFETRRARTRNFTVFEMKKCLMIFRQNMKIQFTVFGGGRKKGRRWEGFRKLSFFGVIHLA